MNKITNDYLNLSKDNNKNFLNNLETLTSNLNTENVESSIFDTGYCKQFRISIDNNIYIHINKTIKNRKYIYSITVSFDKFNYLQIKYNEILQNENIPKEILEYLTRDFKNLNGKILDNNGMYLFKNENNIFKIEFYSHHTLEKLQNENIMPYPDSVKEMDTTDTDIFTLANSIILNYNEIFNINKNTHIKKKEHNYE